MSLVITKISYSLKYLGLELLAMNVYHFQVVLMATVQKPMSVIVMVIGMAPFAIYVSYIILSAFFDMQSKIISPRII